MIVLLGSVHERESKDDDGKADGTFLSYAGTTENDAGERIRVSFTSNTPVLDTAGLPVGAPRMYNFPNRDIVKELDGDGNPIVGIRSKLTCYKLTTSFSSLKTKVAKAIAAGTDPMVAASLVPMALSNEELLGVINDVVVLD